MFPADSEIPENTPSEPEPPPVEETPVVRGDWLDDEPVNVELVDQATSDVPAGTDFLEVSPVNPVSPPPEMDDFVAAAFWEAQNPLGEDVPVAEVVARRRRPRRRELTCWRCGRYDTPRRDGRCRECDALLTGEDGEELRPRRRSRRRRQPPRRVENSSLLLMLVVFAAMMCVSVIWLLSTLLNAGKMDETALLRGTAIFEIVDAVVVLLGILAISRCDFPSQEATVRVLVWGAAVPLLGICLALNVLYTQFWRELLRVGGQPAGPPMTTVVILVFCLQPAVVEEIFFRYLALGVLRNRTGMHGAVWITAMMFALMHVANPLGMPYLFILGAFLGYARVWGGMALPMILHFFHNYAVLAMSN